MKTLFKNGYQEIILHEEAGIFEERFLKDSDSLFGGDYIKEVSLLGDVIRDNQPNSPFKKLIINTLKGGPTMEPKVQDFMHHEFYPRIWEYGIRLKAYCLGEEIISKLSVELTAEGNTNDENKFKYKFFSTLEEGVAWLKSLD